LKPARFVVFPAVCRKTRDLARSQGDFAAITGLFGNARQGCGTWRQDSEKRITKNQYLNLLFAIFCRLPEKTRIWPHSCHE
jgi:hypothetical protein